MITIEQNYGQDKLFFNFVYVGRNAQTWKNLAQKNKENPNFSEIAGGVNGFLHSLSFNSKTHVWVAYISNNKPKYKWLSNDEFKDVEMLVSVLSSEQALFSMHMGIFRSLLYSGTKHSNISMKLHAFAAMQIANDQNFEVPKKYMITSPLDSMFKIMQKSGLTLYEGGDNQVIKIECDKKSNGEYDTRTFKSLIVYYADNQIARWESDNPNLIEDLGWFINHPDTLLSPNPLVAIELRDLAGLFDSSDYSYNPSFGLD